MQRLAHGYHASAKLVFRVVERTRAVIPNADPGLVDHARGHGAIARRVARASAGSVEGIGRSQVQAKTRLAQGIARLARDAQNELDREERVYDSVTEDGAAQNQGPVYGFPGGRDAHTTCAPPRT